MTEITLDFRGSVSSWLKSHCANWTKTDFHCLTCARKSVWVASDSAVDYGGGDRHICVSCGAEFYGYKSYDEDTAFLVKKLKEVLDE